MRLEALSSRRRCFLLGVGLASAAWSVLGFVHLRRVGGHLRLRPMAELNAGLSSGRARLEPVGGPTDQQAFLGLLKEAGFSPGSVKDLKTALKLQTWVGDQVSKVSPYGGRGRGFVLLLHGRRGGGLLCLGMSDILREALLLLGLPARTVQLTESDFRLTAHAVVEVFLEGRWQVLDPTFNVTYQAEGRALGVSEIQERLWTLGPASVQPVFHGKRQYPADLERDARGWRRYFANAYVYELGGPPDRWASLPPWRYWTGPSLYYYGDHLMLFPALQDWLYFSVNVTLPLVALIAALLAVAPTGRDRPRRA